MNNVNWTKNYRRLKFMVYGLWLSIEVYGLLSSLDCYIVRALIRENVNYMVKTAVRTQEKNFNELTQNVLLPLFQ